MIINDLDLKSNTNCLDSALEYASLGFKVLPTQGLINGICTCGGRANCKPGKHPATKHGVSDSTTDACVIQRWWESGYWLNVAIATGVDIFVFEVDPRHGGDKTLAKLIVEHGDLPETPTVKSGGGGIHYYFQYPAGVIIPSRSGVAEGIDVRGDKGYVLAPPSNHISGNDYEWIVGLDKPIAEAPAWVLALVVKSPPSPAIGDEFTLVMRSEEPVDFASHPGAKEGERNDTFMRLLGVHLDRGDSSATVNALAMAWADKCSPPIPPSDVERRLRWGESKRQDRFGGLDDDTIANVVNDGEQINSAKKLVVENESVSIGDELIRSPSLFATPTQESNVGDDISSIQPPTLSPPSVEASESLHPDAYHGLAGDFVRQVANETEADQAGVLLSFLCAFGNAVGSRPHYAMNAGVHYANLFVSLVGDTASAKGQAFSVVKRLFETADRAWESEAIAYGLSSGEGLVDRVKDDVIDPNVTALRFAQKRLLCVEQEFVKPITAMRREGNTLSAMLRNAWDHQTLEVNTRGNKLRASNAHVSILAHITPDELRKILAGSVEVVNGFANRFLWASVQRSNVLPEGGDPSVGDAFAEPLKMALTTAGTFGRVQRDDEAKALWADVYEELSSAKPGAFGSTTARGHAQTLRLSLIYALLDKSDTIRVEHLRAALAVWSYCEASSRVIFNETASVSDAHHQPEPLEIRLLNIIIQNPGITKTGLFEATGKKIKAEAMDEALATLEARRLAHRGRCQPEHGGRPAECWWPGEPDGDNDDEGDGLTLIMGEDESEDRVGGVSDEAAHAGESLSNNANERINSDEGVAMIATRDDEPELIRSPEFLRGANAEDEGEAPLQPQPPTLSSNSEGESRSLSEDDFYALLMATVNRVDDEMGKEPSNQSDDYTAKMNGIWNAHCLTMTEASRRRKEVIAEAKAQGPLDDDDYFALHLRCAELGR
jgi:Bifunctional DNA primase/polymerase, N-terminal/Protein of unknown function (DUF3987)